MRSAFARGDETRLYHHIVERTDWWV